LGADEEAGTALACLADETSVSYGLIASAEVATKECLPAMEHVPG
jgi:hypothetical protein